MLAPSRLLAPAAQAAFGVTESNFEAGTCVNRDLRNRSSSPEQRLLHAGRRAPEWGITKFELNHTGSGSSVPEGGSLKRHSRRRPARAGGEPGGPAEVLAVAQFSRRSRLPGGNTKVGTTEMEAVAEPLASCSSLPG